MRALLTTLILVVCLSLQSQTAVAPLGSGTIDDPYQISSLENLFWLCAPNDVLPVPDESTRWSKHYVQTANIDASSCATWNGGKGFYPIGHESYEIYPSTPFTGSYDGNKFYISGIYINESILRYTGFFGYCVGATIYNLGLLNVNINGYVCGGLAGNIYNTAINNCYSTGKVTGTNMTGGLIAASIYSSQISKSYSSCQVSGATYVGGFVGVNYRYSLIMDCYSTGNVYGNSGDVPFPYFGGFAGINSDNSTLANSYSIGKVAGIGGDLGGFLGGSNASGSPNSYWDMESSGLNYTSLGGGDGYTTAQMKKFENFPWSPAIWKMKNDTTYPALVRLNNAPFAFRDTLESRKWINLARLLLNDYDIETGQTNLTFKIISATNHFGSISNKIYTFNDGLNEFDTDTVVYCVGELLSTGDTLWGNYCESKLVYNSLIVTEAPHINSNDFVTIYPNKGSGKIIFEIKGCNDKNFSITIFTLTGVTVKNIQINNQQNSVHTLDIGNQPAGWYILEVKSKNNTARKLFLRD